jgi:hypothetical protein
MICKASYLTPRDPGSLQSGVGGFIVSFTHYESIYMYIHHKYFVLFSLEYTIFIL